ncbi:MAG: hypothetical protein HY762_08680 [Planctomycetes bacterium]|nr:hypothetical protein [Planctomycetota bacterium]
MLERDDDKDQSHSEKFDNLNYDQAGKKPADLPAHILKGKEQLLPLARCVLCILRHNFSKYERDFLVAFVTARGNRVQVAEALHIELKTVDNYRTNIIKKIRIIARFLIRMINLAQ